MIAMKVFARELRDLVDHMKATAPPESAPHYKQVQVTIMTIEMIARAAEQAWLEAAREGQP